VAAVDLFAASAVLFPSTALAQASSAPVKAKREVV